MKYQTVLGAGGSIGVDLAKELKSYTGNIRIAGRNPKKVNPADELFSADLTNPELLDKAIENSEIVYVTIGFEYKTKVWQNTWPLFIRNVISSCRKHGAKLVFFDNVYMYDQNEIPHMTEGSRINPPSRKGAVRAEVVKLITGEMAGGNFTALIARSADFYGPGIRNSMIGVTVVDKLKIGKTANWLVDINKKHSFTFTPDAAKATAILGNTPDAYGQVWHLPTDHDTLTGKEWVEYVASEFGSKPKVSVLSKTMVSALGLFVPALKESKEMLYQWDRPYFFDSSKFNKTFNFKPTPYKEGIKQIIELEKRRK